MRLISSLLVLATLASGGPAHADKSYILYNYMADQAVLSCPAAVADIRAINDVWNQDMTPEQFDHDEGAAVFCTYYQANLRLTSNGVMHIQACQANGVPYLEPVRERVHKINASSLKLYNLYCR